MSKSTAKFRVEIIDLSKIDFTPELLRCIPADVVHRFRVLPVRQWPNNLAIVIANPANLAAIDSIAHTLKIELCVCTADAQQIETFIQRLYGN